MLDPRQLQALSAVAAAEPAGPPPVVAVVGRPNVGKSTLVNRILGRREAVVQDLPGVTRDRVSYDASWTGRRFVVQDTGGWEPDAKGLQQLVADQAAVAMKTADAVILVVDAVVGATAGDEAAARIRRRTPGTSAYLTSFQKAAFSLQAMKVKPARKSSTHTPMRTRVFCAGSPIHCR